MVDLDKQFAAMADVSEEDTAYDFVIDEDLRIIAIPERGVVLGVEGDKDANRIRFRMNKTWRGYDMSKFDLRINYQNANGDKNYYTVTSKHTEGNAVVFDWIVAADAVAYQGDVFFIVVGLITTGGMVNCAFHTTLGKAKCLEGLVVDTKTDISEIRDFMATLKAEVEAYGQTFVNAAAASAKAAKASETTAASSASAAKTSETNSVTSAKVAKTSETNASTSASAAKTSETNAGTSAASAQANAKKAEAARDDANTSKTAAAYSAAAAKKMPRQHPARPALPQVRPALPAPAQALPRPARPMRAQAHPMRRAAKQNPVNTCRPQRNISSRCAPLRWARRAGMRPQTP